jgi:hypothetical protein
LLTSTLKRCTKTPLSCACFTICFSFFAYNESQTPSKISVKGVVVDNECTRKDKALQNTGAACEETKSQHLRFDFDYIPTKSEEKCLGKAV